MGDGNREGEDIGEKYRPMKERDEERRQRVIVKELEVGQKDGGIGQERWS